VTQDQRPIPNVENLSRRGVLVAGAAGAAGVAAFAVTGCATYGPQGPAGSDSSTGDAAQPAAPQAAGGTGGAALGSTSDIPVGGGKVFSAQKVVVTQPQAGTFTAFSSVCTHQGCSVDEVANGTINCPCHGSKFAITDGSVTEGPAKKPLPAKQVSADGGSLRLS